MVASVAFYTSAIIVAIATLISQIVTTIIYFPFFFGSKSYISMKWNNFKPSILIYRKIIKVGISMFLLQALTGFSMPLISRNSSFYSDVAVFAMGKAVSGGILNIGRQVKRWENIKTIPHCIKMGDQ